MEPRKSTDADNVVALSDRRKSKAKMDDATAHEQVVVPAVKRLIDEGFSLNEIAEILRVAAEVLRGANET
jgi:hypothetical protein